MQIFFSGMPPRESYRIEKVFNMNNFFLFLLLKPILRFFLLSIYLIIIQKLFNWFDLHTLCDISHVICHTNGLFTGSEDSFGINVPNPNETDDPLSRFRAQNADVEAELFSRIRSLESQLAYGLPPQLNPGEYEQLVRDNLEQSANIRSYQSALALEISDLSILELKLDLQNKVFDLFLSEPELIHILDRSPFQENSIRPEIYEFIENKINPVNSARHAFQRNLLEGTLLHYIRDLQQNGTQSAFYKEFYLQFVNPAVPGLQAP
uniref:Uncharacterized protein n=1 Tax=Nelumbo nucifera TaxID=4432 RepID=A0A822Y276_NELNU|nr:TPA_asm: hypothetical protein HUJ06_027105 [Nelumbo nucifera]